jgi:hypothetical protein
MSSMKDHLKSFYFMDAGEVQVAMKRECYSKGLWHPEMLPMNMHTDRSVQLLKDGVLKAAVSKCL